MASLRYGMMFLAAALCCAMIQKDDFLQGIRDGGLSPEAAESFPWLVGLANRLREKDPSVEPSAPKKQRTCLREVHNFMVGLEDPECEGRPPPPATTMDIEPNGQHDDTVSTAGGAETVPMVVVDANGVQHATTMSCTDDPVAVMMQYVEKHQTFVRSGRTCAGWTTSILRATIQGALSRSSKPPIRRRTRGRSCQ